MKKTLLCLTLVIAFACKSFAYDFESEGFSCNIIGNGQVEVTFLFTPGCFGGELSIPSSVTYNSTTYSVTSIGDSAFYSCSGLTLIIIPNSVTSIGNYAFYGCSGLTSIIIPNSVISVGDYTFCNCSSLTSVTIGNSLTSIGDGAFYGCHRLTSIIIPNSVTSVGDYAFNNCSGLTSMTIGNSVTSIGDGAFRNCIGLTSMTIGNSVTSIGDSAFYRCYRLTSIIIPNSVTSIGDYAFNNCSGLTSILVDANNTIYDSRNVCNAIIETATNKLICGCQTTVIPSNVTSIGDGAFNNCSGLTSISIPNGVTTIGNYAFNICTGLTSISIPNSVTSIGDAAFRWCSGLTSMTIGNSVTSIGDSAFYGCHRLTSIIIPNSVTSVGDYAFNNCSGLTSILVDANNTIYDSRNVCNAIIETATNKLICGCQTTVIPSNVTSIGDGAFINCIGLTSISIPNSVTSIGDGAFSGCSGLTEFICHAATPPSVSSSTFSKYKNVTLYVPANSVTAYSGASYWCKFFIQLIPGTDLSIIGNTNDNTMGTVLGSGTYEENDTAQLVAAPKARYSFVRWSDGDTDNPRDVVVTQDSTFTAEFAIGGGVNDTIYLEYDGKDAMQYALEEHGVYYFGGKVYNQQNLYIKLYYSDGKLLSSGTNDIDMSYYANGIYIVTDGKGGFLKINHYR